MITVSGKEFDSSTLYAEYPADSVERLTLDMLSQSGHDYRYESLDILKFELQLRSETVNAARALYDSAMSFATFHDSRCNPTYWQRTKNGGFLLKEHVSASKAIRDIYQHGDQYATECATAMLIVYYKALIAVYGEEQFDKTFASIYLMDWSIRQPLLQELGTPRPVDDILYGDRAYFINEDVDPSVPWWRGENVIVLPGGMYYGHGVGILDANEIIAHLNANRKRGSTKTAHLLDRAARPNFAKLYDAPRQADRPSQPLVWRFPASLSELLGQGRT